MTQHESGPHAPILRRPAAAVALAAAAAVAVSACGGSGGSGGSGSGGSKGNGVASKAPDQILNSAITAAEAAKSVHVGGAIKDSGQSIGLDLSIVSGEGATGTISEGSASFKLIETGGSFYMQPDQAFLVKFAHSQAAAKLFKGKWLKGSSSDSNFQSFGQLTSIKSLMGSLTQAHGTLTKGSTSTLAGQQVIALKSSKGGTMYVATTGKPYPLQLVKDSGGQSGKVTFSQYNKPFTITAPSNSINLDQLQSAG